MYYLNRLSKENLKEVFGYEFEDFSIENNLNKEILLKLGLVDGIIYNYDSVMSKNISELEIDYENIIEARFFNENIEIRIFNDEGNLTGTIFNERQDCNPIISKFLLYPRYGEGKYAKELEVKKYINYDEDNQAYISYVKPSKLIFKGGK